VHAHWIGTDGFAQASGRTVVHADVANIQKRTTHSAGEVLWREPGRNSPGRRARRWGFWCSLPLLAGLSAFAVRERGDEIPAKLASGCDDVASCRDLVGLAELRMEACTWSCSKQQRDYQVARDLLRQVLENEAARRHSFQEEVSRSSKALHAQAQAKIEQAERRDALVASERAHQRKLELLAFEAEQRSLKEESNRARTLTYLRHLSLEQKRNRLTRCHEVSGNCGDLAELLVDSSDHAAQRRALVQLNEDLLNENIPDRANSTASGGELPQLKPTTALVRTNGSGTASVTRSVL
jgi:hypothetical protein